MHVRNSVMLTGMVFVLSSVPELFVYVALSDNITALYEQKNTNNRQALETWNVSAASTHAYIQVGV